jgi:hypothetical protein
MRAATTALVNYINMLRAEPDAQAIVADCYAFTLLSGLILTYTNADVPVTLNGHVYVANSILVDGLKFKCAAGLEVDQQQITVSARATDTVGGVPLLQALRNGVFDGCEIQRERAFLNSWAPADTANPIGSVILFKVGLAPSIMSGARRRRSPLIRIWCSSIFKCRGMSMRQPASTCCTIPVHAHQECIWDGGDSWSRFDRFGRQLVRRLDELQPGDNYINAGVTANVKSAIAGVSLDLSYPLLNAPSAGDAFTAYFGCDHTMGTCGSPKFNNLANFRGFPFIPPATYAF